MERIEGGCGLGDGGGGGEGGGFHELNERVHEYGTVVWKVWKEA